MPRLTLSSICRLAFAALLCISLSGCIGAIVGTVVDVGIEVAKVPFKVGKAVVDVATDDDEDEADKKRHSK
jgi:hypothetical protein